MKLRKLLALILTLALLGSALPACMAAGEDEIRIVLSDDVVTVDGAPASTDSADAVYVGAEIVYYHDGTDASYGEGKGAELHSAEEAAAHTVVTITRAGIYRISGVLSKGQIAIDLGKKAKSDPSAAVTLILDGADVTCTVAPALIFYNVYECDQAFLAYDNGENPDFKASPVVDTSAAGANVILADGSVNNFTGSHVARIYKEGSTKKLHKYDAAFYSKMSMNIGCSGGEHSEALNCGVLNIVGDNEGLDSELHLTINGGWITIQSQDDGINTNEDYVSVTTINGGILTVDAGNGSEGDGIDSNGYLVINGGTIRTTAHPAADGGIDADSPIQLNGGTVSAFGGRNDAADSSSKQPYMELTFASRLPAGSLIELKDEAGSEVWTATLSRECQSVTLATPDLALNTTYHLYVDGVLQCWNGNTSGFGAMFGGGFGGGRPGGFQGPDGVQPPEMPPMDGQQPPEIPNGQQGGRPFDRGERPDGFDRGDFKGGRFDDFDPGQLPPDFDPDRFGHGGFGGQAADGSGSTDFILTDTVKSFSCVCDSDASGKTRVSFTVDGVTRVGMTGIIEAVKAITPSVEIDPALVQVTITDDPSESYAASCLLSDGLEAVNGLLPSADGDYILTVAVAAGTEGYTGATQVSFTVGALPFTDLIPGTAEYAAVRVLYRSGAMLGTGNGRFSPDLAVTRAQAVTVLARMAGAEAAETDSFSDVAAGSWYAGYVGWAVDHGIVQGDGQGHFFPDETVTAEQMALMLGRANSEYADQSGLTGPLTRGQMAAMIVAGMAM